ncbi:MAG: ComEA family DNA-binding protein [Actinomycetota bacterium]
MSSELSIRDRLATLSRRELAGLVALVLGLVGAAGVWYVRSLPATVAVQQVAGAAAPVGDVVPLAAPTATASDASIFVHVAGQVRRPGVYEFTPGDRVIDAIDAARGASPRAVLDGLNLAAPLADGTQIVVPARGGATADLPADVSDPADDQIDVNTADATELEELSGIGEVLAQAIIDYRTENGPFGAIDELEDVSGIGPATLEEIRDHVTI